jgi:dTDP-4-dehydrorhamnose 3,5-epimerase
MVAEGEMMLDTVVHTRIAEYFDGRVTIDELKQFSDSRGFVCELWRTDDEQMNSSYVQEVPNKSGWHQSRNPKVKENEPQMCYFSHTEPLVMRGPHEHEDQTDWFITIKSKMIYMLVDEEGNVAHFVTDPDKMYRIKVEPGIIHSYRNLSIDDIAVTANFPSSLFMGVAKEDDIDEIRHEPKVEENQNFYILGAGGRLGKALTKKLLDEMGIHKYNVIPVYEKFDNTSEGMGKLNRFLDNVLDEENRTSSDVIINCIAKTNVQEDSDSFTFSNFQLPKYLTEFAVRHKFHFINFSTDYVFQTGQLSPYTESKKKYEDWLETFYNESNLIGTNILSMQKYVHIIRLANLFSQDEDDVHNALYKLWNAKESGPVCIPENLIIMPTDVSAISEFLTDKYLFHLDSYEQFINLSGTPYTVEYLFEMFFEEEVDFNYVENPRAINNPKAFFNRSCFYRLDCDEMIRQKVQTIKNGHSRQI